VRPRPPERDAGPAGPEPSLGEHARRAACTYGAAADHYGVAALGFWDRFGAATP